MLVKEKTNRRLVLELSVVLCCKIAIIVAICIFFFGPETKVPQTADSVSSAILTGTHSINNQGEN